jgi:hypothetical protein
VFEGHYWTQSRLNRTSADPDHQRHALSRKILMPSSSSTQFAKWIAWYTSRCHSNFVMRFTWTQWLWIGRGAARKGGSECDHDLSWKNAQFAITAHCRFTERNWRTLSKLLCPSERHTIIGLRPCETWTRSNGSIWGWRKFASISMKIHAGKFKSDRHKHAEREHVPVENKCRKRIGIRQH